jgi:hypothetical protein
MIHIRQKLDLSAKQQTAYTIVITDGWNQPLEEHPSIVEHPEIFEIVDTEIPETAQYLKYT